MGPELSRPNHHFSLFHLGYRQKPAGKVAGLPAGKVEGGLKVFSLNESRGSGLSLELNAIAFCSGVHCRQQMEQQREPADGETRPQQLRRVEEEPYGTPRPLHSGAS